LSDCDNFPPWYKLKLVNPFRGDEEQMAFQSKFAGHRSWYWIAWRDRIWSLIGYKAKTITTKMAIWGAAQKAIA
jgi:hypothetical protein